MEVRKIVSNIFFKPLTIIQSYKIQKLLQILLHKAHKLMWQWMWFDIVIDVIGGFQLPNKWMFDFILFFILWLVISLTLFYNFGYLSTKFIDCFIQKNGEFLIGVMVITHKLLHIQCTYCYIGWNCVFS